MITPRPPTRHTRPWRGLSLSRLQVIDLVEDVFDSDEGKGKDFLYQNYVNGVIDHPNFTIFVTGKGGARFERATPHPPPPPHTRSRGGGTARTLALATPARTASLPPPPPPPHCHSGQ